MPAGGIRATGVSIGRILGLWLAASVGWCGTAAAQADTTGQALHPHVHTDTLTASAPQPYQLTPIILPGSEVVRVDGIVIDTSAFRMDYRFARLWIDGIRGDERIVVTYRTLPFRLRDAYSLYTISPDDTSRASDAAPPGGVIDSAAASQLLALPPASRLQHRGSITRGILAGSNRDVTVESGLRMELSGEVADGIQVQAVLTDENTPILPEGTTQRIEEFDRVFIGIEAPYGSARLGDFDLSLAAGEFGRFDRKLQGASADVEIPAGPLLSGGRLTVAGATSRGTFRAQDVEPIDGMQGPYRLEGAEGERFVLVVPGSEAVYVDGELLTRGETNDYTIDYATAEITFTPNVLITSDRRIRVEFQYSTGQFTRTLLASEATAGVWPTTGGRPRLRFGAAVLREADSRDFIEEFGFGPADSLALAEAGDGLAAAPGAEPVPFDPESPFVQYRLEVVGTDTIFVALDRAPEQGTQVYRVRFSRVGAGLGSYARVGRSVNGIVYEHRGPGGGDYLPIRILQKPKEQRLIDLHGAVEPIAGFEVFGEWARSDHDQNRLSPIDDHDDQGDAYHVGVRLKQVDVGPIRVSGNLRRRFLSGTFESFNRIRPVEFERRWNLGARRTTATGGVVGAASETIDEADVLVGFFEHSTAGVEIGRIELGDGFEGLRRAATVISQEPGWPQFDYRVELIGSRDFLLDERGKWLRQLGIIRYPVARGRLVPRFEVEHERRRQRHPTADSLARPSFTFLELRPGITWASEKLELDGFVEHRTEDDWNAGIIRPAATSWTGMTRFAYRPSGTFDMDGNLGYRSRRFTEAFRVEQNREDLQSLIVRFGTNFRPLQRALQLNWMYEAMAERTPTLQEIYVRTGPEIGQYVWEDANGDGLIQVDEMIPERLPTEGTYVRTFIPSDSLTSVTSVQARLRLELDPRRLWSSPSSTFQRWMSEVSTRTVVEVREKTRDPRLAGIYLLYLDRFRDPIHSMNGRLRFAQDVFLFRHRPNFGVDVSFNQLRSLSELAAGMEDRFVNSWRMEVRGRPAEAWSLRAVFATEQDRLLSESFASRTYDIETLRAEPEVSYALARDLRLIAAPELAHKSDGVGDRRARVLKLPLELRYTRPRRLEMTARAETADVALTGDAVGLAQYELTDGRGPGRSYLWSLRGQYTVNQYLRASFSYDGRAPAEARVIHTLQLQLSALF